MRIQQLRFQNLNSLEGEWSIDFTAPDYLANGIFAITGPTGAGKTTILDAICLALYGRTPRLNRVNKSANEIMSRQTGYCYAEIIFETRDGCYRCHWSQQRARKKADGELQMPKHEISDFRSGKVLESKIRDVALSVEQITGMNFDQFTRSILLAQGGFAAFLQAPADERAPILEQITGTAIYSEISMQVHQRHREEKNCLDGLQAQIVGMKGISEAEEQSMQEGLQAKINQENEQQKQLASLQEALGWLDKLTGLEGEISELEAQWQHYMLRREVFQENGLRLARALQAMALDGPYSKLSALRNQQESDLTEMAGIRSALPLEREVFTGTHRCWGEEVQNLDVRRVLRKVEGETAKKVREMDLLIKQHEQQIDAIQATITTDEAEYAGLQADISNAKIELEKMEGSLAAIEAYLQNNRRDAALVTNLTGITGIFKRLEEIAAILENKRLALRQAVEAVPFLSQTREEVAALHTSNEQTQELNHKKLQYVQEQLENTLQGHEIFWWRDELDKFKEQKNKQQELEQRLFRIKQIEADLQCSRASVQQSDEQDKLLAVEIEQYGEKSSSCEAEVSLLEKQVTLLNRIRSLEEERARLEDGSPCPLCGATIHPFAAGNLPHMDETELALQKARDRFKQLSEDLYNRQLQKARVEKEWQHSLAAMQESQALLEKERTLRNGIMHELDLDLEAIKSSDIVQDLLSQTAHNIIDYVEQIKSLEALQKGEKELNQQYEESRLAFVKADKLLQQAASQHEQAQKDEVRLQQEYAALLNDVNQLRQGALRDVAVYGISDFPLEELPVIILALGERKNKWEAQQAEKVDLQKATHSAQTELVHQCSLLESQKQLLLNECSHLETLQEQYREKQLARFEIYAQRSPDEEEAHMDEEITVAEGVVELAREDMEKAQRNQERLEERDRILTVSTRHRGLELLHLEDSFAQQVLQAGFEDETDYLQASLSREEQQILSAQAEKLKEEKTELQTRLQDRQESLRQEKSRKLTEKPGDVLEEERQLVEKELKELRDEIGADKRFLQNTAENRQQMQEQLQKIAQQKEAFQRWQILHDLIGSSDGKKYRNFAQGLTFDIMINHANRQLQKMSDRYRLLRNRYQALELNVIDHYQAGEIRSTANLSGGESFLVSLALALGLSQMASHKVSVDSLFLDEGFGSLDEDTLDTALNTLAGLQQDGKLIGVISHVSALKERISTQIQVISKAGGRSIITGPGCKRVS
jgi:exonuclease SbcC